MKAGWQAPLAVLVVVILFAAFGAKPMQSAADIAAWVQGVGSLLAIIAAIVIYAKQYKDKQADDENETRAFVEAIREEVQAAWDGYSTEIHPALLALPDGQPFNVVYPVSTETFPIYENGASMVGKIDDPELRRTIVKTYSLARGLISTFQLNNSLLTEYKQLSLLYFQSNRNEVLETHAIVVRDYAAKLKERDRWITEAVAALLLRTNQWLASHPAR